MARFQKLKNLDPKTKEKVIGMAWEDKSSFEDIEERFKLTEFEVINLMRRELKPASWKIWRKRVSGKLTKHKKLYLNKRNNEKAMILRNFDLEI